MANPKWFDADVYMQNKLAQLKAQEPDANWSWDKLYDAFRDAGFVGEEGQYAHFVKFGAAEEVAPNAYFNADEYYAAKAKQYYEEVLKQEFTGSEEQIAHVKSLIKNEGMNAWTHYQQFGSAEGVDPSNAFDASAYCAAKAEAMNKAGQKAPDGTEWTAEKIADAIADAGMSVLEHYMTYAGTGEGEVEAGATYPVPDDDQVVVPNSGVTIVVDNDGTSYNGTAGDDSFYVKTGSTLQGYHTLDGGEGNDTLTLVGQELGGATIRNIENLVVNGGAGGMYDMNTFSTSFTLNGGTATVENVASQKLIADGAQKLTVEMAADQTSVDLTSQNRTVHQSFVLKGDSSLTSVKLAVDESAQWVNFTDSAVEVTDLAVTATVSEAKNDKAIVSVGALDDLVNVSMAGAGAVDLRITTANAALKTVDATANTGGVTVDLSKADNAAFTGGAGADMLTVNGSNVAHTLGAGDDTVVVKDAAFGALAKGFSVDGGEGTDTLSMASAVATDVKMTADVFNKTFTNFEELTISDKLAGNLDISGYTGIDHLTLSGANDGEAITMQSGSTLELTKGAEGTGTYGSTLTVSVADAAAGKADVLNIALTGDGAVDGNTITVADVETINVVATDTDGDSTDPVITHTLTLKADKATSVTVSGDAKLNLTLDAASTDITDINASENTGGLKVDVNVGDLSGVTVTGSSAADEITLGAQTVATGGEGADKFTVSSTEMTKYATITDFDAGDTIKMGGAADNTLGKAISLQDTAQFADYVNEAVKGSSTNDVSWFTFGENTYLVLDAHTDTTFNATSDMVVQLQGVFNLEGMTFDSGSMTLPEGA